MEALVNEIFNSESDQDIQKPNQPMQCGICGNFHFVTECDISKVTNHIPNKTIPSKARLTLPDTFEIKKLCDASYNIHTKYFIEKGTQFGPFEAKKSFTLLPSIDFPMKIFTNGDEDFPEYFLDTSDETECNWMIFVSPATDNDEQNDGEHLYYSTIKDIHPGEYLKVWYSPFYATKMKKSLLQKNSVEDYVKETNVDIEAALQKNKNVMPRDSWSCKFCGKVEKTLSVFATHLLDHYKANYQANKTCAICNDTFIGRQMLNKHLKTVHANLIEPIEAVKENKKLIDKIKKQESKEASVGGPLLLNSINVDSLDNSSLLLPQTDLLRLDLNGIGNQSMLMESENLNVDNIINDNVKQLDDFNFELNELESEQFVCDICLKTFMKLQALIQHLEQHTGRFQCNKCNMVYTRKENLTHHLCTLYYKIKCSLCDKIFFQKKYLTLHIKGHHNKEFTCDKCGKFYESKSSLDSHNCQGIPAHKRQKYPCSLCPKVFFTKKNFYEHKVRHEGNQKRTCEICNLELANRKSYIQHVKMHDGPVYPCDLCGNSFKRKDTLEDHQALVHQVGVQPVSCELCEKTFKTKVQLKKHKLVHNESKAYKCSICEALFKYPSNLRKHINNVHNSDESKIESLFKEETTIYTCPKCNKNMKLRSSLLRHLKTHHPNYEISRDVIKPKQKKLDLKKPEAEDESVMDLKETIENMNFNTDEVNNCSENNDINMEIDKILNNAGNIDNFLNDSNDKLVDSLINIAAKENHLNVLNQEYGEAKEVCLSMPDLSADQEIKLGENAYILDNGTIVEPQESPSKVVVYILDQNKFT